MPHGGEGVRPGRVQDVQRQLDAVEVVLALVKLLHRLVVLVLEVVVEELRDDGGLSHTRGPHDHDAVAGLVLLGRQLLGGGQFVEVVFAELSAHALTSRQHGDEKGRSGSEVTGHEETV